MRRHLLAGVVAFLASLHAAGGPPNLLFILTDDQGYGDVGRHGNPVLKTPNLDRLHDESVRFADFCVSSSCSPTRAALMSGLFNLRVGVTHTIAPRCRLDPSVTILPQVLKSAGYATACIGKWHLSSGEGTAPGDRGFDYVAGKPAHLQGGRYREDILFDEAIGFMERNADRPFFCYLATWSPHTPLIVPDTYVEPYRGRVDDETAKFLGMVANIDENVGRILRRLDETGLATNTVVVFMNDNGGTHGVDTWNAGMRGCKCTAWPGGHRAISFWRWPGRWAPRDVPALTAHVDVLPTLAALAGADLPAPSKGRTPDGRSLVPFLEGRDDPWFGERMVFQHNTRWPGGTASRHKDCMAGVRWREYLLVRSRGCGDVACIRSGVSQCGALASVERGSTTATYTKNAQFVWGLTPGDGWALYDVRKDPACRENLAGVRGDIARKLRAAYDRWWEAIFPEMIAAGGDAPLSESAVEGVRNRRK
jgi:arylsulfatase A-like enzyme